MRSLATPLTLYDSADARQTLAAFENLLKKQENAETREVVSVFLR